MPLDEIVRDIPMADIDMQFAESSHIPLVLKTTSNMQEKNANDQQVAESTNVDVIEETAESEGRSFAAESNGDDVELSASYNVEVQAENSNPSPDFDIHSQGEDNSKSGFRISLFQAPVKTRESVNLEAEGVPSKVLSAYDNSQKAIADRTQPIPIVDTISEHEKYGNNGDMFDGISRSLVNGYEAFSNFLNTIIQKPKEIFKSINKSVNAQLDIIGGKLVGL
ncbi:uncharacterized protein LOC106085548 [Stomoxys calcitrans]|uniref:uncharacterized protein LOC106085548 n=1 Tax=Stomoxys calcitrans TaxID=35570 RepID=UPI0027E220B6|nr:uncharacterized protein LOC106085548 [Stomoxys calcitrans]